MEHIESTNIRTFDFLIITNDAKETFNLGRRLGFLLKASDIVALVGELGTGKTWLAKGIASGLNVPDHEYVNSPAFDLIHEYSGRFPVYHMDFYRLENLSPEDYYWLNEYLVGEGVCVVEWANKFIDELIDSYLKVELLHVDAGNKRELRLTAVGQRYNPIIEELKKR